MCACNGTPTVSTMTVEELQAAQEARQEASRIAREQYAASMLAAMTNAGATSETVNA